MYTKTKKWPVDVRAQGRVNGGPSFEEEGETLIADIQS